jgi:uncharacterized protein YjbI with pentapeptide repeats
LLVTAGRAHIGSRPCIVGVPPQPVGATIANVWFWAGIALMFAFFLATRAMTKPSADLRRCNLDHALLSGATLNRADLGGASLWQADLAGACLGEVNLQGARLDHADLRGADLRGADLARASVWGAHVEGTDLRETIGLGPEQLSVLRR